MVLHCHCFENLTTNKSTCWLVLFIHHTLGHVCHCLTEHCVKTIHLELWNFADKLVKEVLTALYLFRTMLLDMIQNALQAVCGYHSMLRTTNLEFCVIAGSDFTYAYTYESGVVSFQNRGIQEKKILHPILSVWWYLIFWPHMWPLPTTPDSPHLPPCF